MIWSLVSILFWIIASVLGFVGIDMVCIGLSGYDSEYFLIGLGCLACSGCVAYLAARLVS